MESSLYLPYGMIEYEVNGKLEWLQYLIFVGSE